MKKFMVFTFMLVFSTILLAETFQIHGVTLQQALQEIAQAFNTSIIVSDNVNGMVELDFEADDIEESLKMLLLNTDYTFAKVKDFYIVGNADSSDVSHVALFKTKVIFLKDTYPQTVYTLLGSFSKYVVYSPNTMALVVDADERTLKKIEKIISEVDVPNSNIFFSYEVHELSRDEYERFRQFEEVNKSATLKFSNTSFSIFKEMIKLEGKSDAFGTVVLPLVGKLEVNSNSPAFKMFVTSNKNEIGVSVQTAGNAITFEIDPKIHDHAVALLKANKKTFLVTVNVAKTPRAVTFLKNIEKPKKHTLKVTFKDEIQNQVYASVVSYGSPNLSFLLGYTFDLPATQTISIGMRAKMIENLFGTLEVRLSNLQPSVYVKLEDTTKIGVFRFNASVSQILSMNGWEPTNASASIGVSFWNIKVFGGLEGQWDSPLPFVKAGAQFGWFFSTLKWRYTEGYTVESGVTLTW